MKIAYLVNQYPSVSHTFIRREILALEAQGLDVARFTIRADSKPIVDEADQAERQRTRVLLDPGYSWRLVWALLQTALSRPRRFGKALRMSWRLARRSQRGWPLHLAYLAEACVLRGWLEAGEVKHVHAHFGTNSAAVALLCRLLGGPPYSFTVHGPKEFDAPWFLSLDEKIRHSAFTVAISNFGRSQLCRWADHRDWPKIRVVRCGLDEMYLNRGPIAPPPNNARLVCVGRLVEQKGPQLLIEAAGRLRDLGIDFELVLIGDGPLRADLEQLIQRLDLSDQIRLAGVRDGGGVRRELLAARAMVLPSFAEGLPVVLMEAMALGRPVLSTYVAGIPELVEPGVSGWLVSAGSIEALTEAMAEVLSADVATLEQMGRAGAARVAERHDVWTEAARLAALLTGVDDPLNNDDRMQQLAISTATE